MALGIYVDALNESKIRELLPEAKRRFCRTGSGVVARPESHDRRYTGWLKCRLQALLRLLILRQLGAEETRVLAPVSAELLD